MQTALAAPHPVPYGPLRLSIPNAGHLPETRMDAEPAGYSPSSEIRYARSAIAVEPSSSSRGFTLLKVSDAA